MKYLAETEPDLNFRLLSKSVDNFGHVSSFTLLVCFICKN